MRQAKFCLRVVRCCFLGMFHFCPTFQLIRLKMSEIILTGRKSKIKKTTFVFYILDPGALVSTVKDRLNRRNQRSPNTSTGQEVGHMTSTEGQGHLVEVEDQGADTGNIFLITAGAYSTGILNM